MGRPRQSTDLIVVHCSATKARFVDVDATDIDRWHKAKGWLGIGYHFVILRDGTLEKGRDVDAIGAHVYGHNLNSIGICVVGGLDPRGDPEDNFTVEQKEMLAVLIIGLTLRYGVITVVGHRDFSPDLDGDGIIEEFEWLKACPCFDVRPWWDEQKEAYFDAILD